MIDGLHFLFVRFSMNGNYFRQPRNNRISRWMARHYDYGTVEPRACERKKERRKRVGIERGERKKERERERQRER